MVGDAAEAVVVVAVEKSGDGEVNEREGTSTSLARGGRVGARPRRWASPVAGDKMRG